MTRTALFNERTMKLLRVLRSQPTGASNAFLAEHIGASLTSMYSYLNILRAYKLITSARITAPGQRHWVFKHTITPAGISYLDTGHLTDTR